MRFGAMAILLAAASTACTPTSSFLALGADAEHAARPAPTAAPTPDATASAEPPPPPWELAAELRRLHPASPRAPSEHVTGQLDCEVLADDAAAAYPALGPLRPVGPGATLVERIFVRDAPDVEAYFAMVKRAPGYDPPGGDWEYLVLDAAGQLEQRGRLPLCTRCHADAPHDHLFGTTR